MVGLLPADYATRQALTPEPVTYGPRKEGILTWRPIQLLIYADKQNIHVVVHVATAQACSAPTATAVDV